ncbi:MAG: DUF262 domain-containing protein [Rhodobacteraceae bacterium]|nr:DUF262 domain-containing protein [Paracoccaceae bacterium]
MSNDQTSELEEDSELQDSECEDQLLGFNPSDIDIGVEALSLDILIDRIRHSEIDMNTDFQRNPDLWDNRKMSRLIESILIRLPLPAFYFDASEDDNWLIVDGLQRLSTIRKFVIENNLRLRNLEFLTNLNGTTYDRLNRNYQRRIKEYQITVYKIKPGTPNDVKYSVFRRINTGGLTLNNQEIRNALAKPRDREFLKELTQIESTKVMLGDLSKRMKDQELVLRFWAFYSFNFLDPKNKKDLASFLDKAMEELKTGNDDYRSEFKRTFSLAIDRCLEMLGTQGFAKNPLEVPHYKNSTLFEVWMVTMAGLSQSDYSNLQRKKTFFQEKAFSLLSDTDFFNSITFSTLKQDHVEIRYRKVNDLISEVLND